MQTLAGCAGFATIADNNALIHRLTGLDPGGPLYYLSLSTSDMIYKTNAGWVDLYHTGRGGLGDSRTNSGDIDVFVNGGSSQPGCPFPSTSDPLRELITFVVVKLQIFFIKFIIIRLL